MYMYQKNYFNKQNLQIIFFDLLFFILSQLNGQTTNRRMDSLSPFSSYMFHVEACTLGGCQKSASSSTIRTLEDGKVNQIVVKLLYSRTHFVN